MGTAGKITFVTSKLLHDNCFAVSSNLLIFREDDCMAVGKSVESISPFTVYKRVIIGAVLAGIGLFLPVHDSNDQTLKWGLIFVGVFLFVWGMNSVRNPRLALK